AQREFWYQPFHALRLIEELLDGRPDAVRAYLRHFWSRWSGPAFSPDERRLDHLAEAYGQPGAMTASVAWYRAGSGMVAMSLAEQAPAPEDRITARPTVLARAHAPPRPRSSPLAHSSRSVARSSRSPAPRRLSRRIGGL